MLVLHETARRCSLNREKPAMVTTRRRCTAEAELRRQVPDCTEVCTVGLIWWFRVKEGLNGYGFIPGTNLGDEQCSREEYVEFWGQKNYHNGGRYKRRVSPKMVRRIRYLYQRCFQRPVGASDAIPYHFGRGLLAEKNGHPVNWAAYARENDPQRDGTRHIWGQRHLRLLNCDARETCSNFSRWRN
ncbi:hypothetical protein M758_UG217000 [Ceratodon purpureus]|nr:hypothetical protein M758_UG217000 [Ceratodon purpureus]